jgi:hypothetical protein
MNKVIFSFAAVALFALVGCGVQSSSEVSTAITKIEGTGTQMVSLKLPGMT